MGWKNKGARGEIESLSIIIHKNHPVTRVVFVMNTHFSNNQTYVRVGTALFSGYYWCRRILRLSFKRSIFLKFLFVIKCALRTEIAVI